MKNAKVALANAEADIQDTRHTLPSRSLGTDGLTVDTHRLAELVVGERFLRLQLVFEHGEVGFRRVVALARTRDDALT